MDIKAAMLSANSLFKGFLNKTHKPESSGALTAALQEKYNQSGKEERQKLMKFRVENTSIFLLFSKESTNRSAKRF